MKTNYETDKDETFCQTYGGQEWLESDYEVDDYGIQIGDLSISGIPSKLMVRLACEMVNHLIINGHKFELKEINEQDRKIEFKYNG